MSPSIRCKHCGSAIAFDQQDRGFEVYCPSCARANPIPKEPEAGPPGRPAAQATVAMPSEAPTVEATVFSAQGAEAVKQRAAGEAACLCGATVPISVQDVGGTVYCPSCGAEIEVGGTLSRTGYRVVPRTQEEQPATKTPIPIPAPRLRWLTSPSAVAAWLVVALLAGLGGYLTWKYPEESAGAVQKWIFPILKPDEGPPEAAAVGPEVQPAKPPHTFTPDSRPASEPQEVASRLGRFDQLVEALADALKAKNVPAARTAFRQADEFLRKQPEELALHCRRFLSLKMRLQGQEAVAGGAPRVRELLDSAQKALDAGRLAETLETEARAKFLARITPALTEAQGKSLDEQSRQLAARIRFARGKRAVADALAAAKAGDRITRNRETARAFSLLPGFPESQIKPLLDQVRPWQEEAAAAARAGTGRGTATPLARQIQRRDDYEAVLEHYGNADLPKLTAACWQLEDALRDASPEERRQYEPARDRLFDLLEREVVARLPASDLAAEPQKVAQTLAELRRLVDQAKPWAADYRWKTLDGALRAQEDR